MNFATITKREATRLVIRYHYAHRVPPISWAWGIIVNGRTLGVLTVGKPISPSLCNGVCGKERSADVLELNRLWLDDRLPVNSESNFIGWCLREIRRERPSTILVSYADTLRGHIGIVYQATNWAYTGMSAPFSDKTEQGDILRSQKHRYVWFANANDKQLLRWQTFAYPKLRYITAA
jgi:hypothetical protein